MVMISKDGYAWTNCENTHKQTAASLFAYFFPDSLLKLTKV